MSTQDALREAVKAAVCNAGCLMSDHETDAAIRAVLKHTSVSRYLDHEYACPQRIHSDMTLKCTCGLDKLRAALAERGE